MQVCYWSIAQIHWSIFTKVELEVNKWSNRSDSTDFFECFKFWCFFYTDISRMCVAQNLLLKILIKGLNPKNCVQPVHQECALLAPKLEWTRHCLEKENLLLPFNRSEGWVAVGVSLLPGAEVERRREKQPLCSSDVKATGCDRMSHPTAGRTRKNL